MWAHICDPGIKLMVWHIAASLPLWALKRLRVVCLITLFHSTTMSIPTEIVFKMSKRRTEGNNHRSQEAGSLAIEMRRSHKTLEEY
jgi:hypothetical protein